jgi:hypothetical protein
LAPIFPPNFPERPPVPAPPYDPVIDEHLYKSTVMPKIALRK